MAAEEDFINRWSRRKAQARREAEPAVEPQAEIPVVEPASPPEPLPELPDPETLDATSDFRPFLADGVPAALKRQALRRLWRVNPVIGALDGLDDYYVTQDFTDAATVIPDLKTVYRVGKELVAAVRRVDEELPDGRPPTPADAPPAITRAEPAPEADDIPAQPIVSDLERI
jgi:hypothetical protein